MKEEGTFLGLEFVPEHILTIMRRIFDSGFEVWLVGGAIRDFLLGWTPKDWDLATSADPHQVVELFPRVIPVGMRHGTVRIHVDPADVEVTSFDRPGQEGILADLNRRDFTVNALALSYPEGRILDPHGGREDLRLRMLRAVGNPRARFREDPLRMLRVGRFLSVYGFRVHRTVSAAVKNELDGLERVAPERIRDEMLKAVLGRCIADAFRWMRRTGVLGKVLPELEGRRRSDSIPGRPSGAYRHTVATLRRSPPRLRVRLAALFHDLGGIGRRIPRRERRGFSERSKTSSRLAMQVMNRWRMSQKQMREVSVLVENHIPRCAAGWERAGVRRLMAAVGEDLLEDLLDLAHAALMESKKSKKGRSSLDELHRLRSAISHELQRHAPLAIKDLVLDGQDVMRILSLTPGPRVGRVLEELLAQVLDNPAMNERDTLTHYLKEKYDPIPELH